MQARKNDSSVIVSECCWLQSVAGISESRSAFVNPACPWLPAVSGVHDVSIVRSHAGVKGADFYEAALRYAHFQWRTGKPAQALLQLNKAWMADLGEGGEIFETLPPPYRALAWMLEMAVAGECGFFGNPVRHFQHLASRMSGPRSEVRMWRAWVCFHLAEEILGNGEFPRDGRQIVREGLWIPSLEYSLSRLGEWGWPGEVESARVGFRRSFGVRWGSSL